LRLRDKQTTTLS